MNRDEIKPASSYELAGRNFPGTVGGDLRALMPGWQPPNPGAGGQEPGGTLSVMAAIAAAIINSAMVTHSITVTVIVTISVLTAALARQ
jgi:hypothetical protein